MVEKLVESLSHLDKPPTTGSFFKEQFMPSVVEGGTFEFTVVAKNKSGTVVAVGDAAVALSDSTLGTVTVNGDGSGGVFTAVKAGDVTLTPSAGGTTGTAYPLTVTPDLVVASVEIVPNAPATVEIQPA